VSMKHPPPWNIAIIGAGKVGQTLGRVLLENGQKIAAIVSRTESSAVQARKFLRCSNSGTSLSLIPSSVSLIYITTPHAVVPHVADALSSLEGLDFSRVSVCHASGMLSAEVLSPLRPRGAKVFSFHPLQTFPRDFLPKDIVPHARGIYYGVDGDDRSMKVARQFARRLEGKIMTVDPRMRALYHAACVVASNHLTTMLSVVEEMYRVLKTEDEDFFRVFKPIIMATLANVERTSPAQALSGPVARGGVATVAEHIQAIAGYSPDLLPYFLGVSRETVRLAVAKGSLTSGQEKEMLQLISSSIK
jgi:predicted short-subunit dehydrogenase-like oxidoreductase (DUF2520 family)